MQTNVYLPQLELNMENVSVTNVLVHEGDSVAAGEGLIEVESEKAVTEVPSPQSGFVRKLFVQPGDVIGGNAVLCILTDTADEPYQKAVSPNAAGTTVAGPTSEEGLVERSATAPTAPEPSEGPIKAAPAARKLAKEVGMDLNTVQGTGPGGRITVEDVQKARETVSPRATGECWTPLPPSRLALIAQMQKSLAEMPQFHVARRLVVGPLLAKGDGVTFTHRLVRATAAALAKHPALRTFIQGNQVTVAPVSVAIAMETPRGLVAPVVRKADTLSLEEISRMTNELRSRAEAGTLRGEELDEAPFAISNLGMLGVDFFQPFVFHGQTAVLAAGRAVEAHAWFCLAADHRVVDGAEAARFLETLQQEILRA